PAADLAEAPQPEVVVETLGGDDAVEQRETRERRRRNPIRQYKIQEVIKRRQILLVQVVKEERGNKGAALTTYLSLAGRYCVLMPNTPRGGGISRKITDLKDRRRLKSILEEFEIPDGMSVIVRTAGMERSKAEIKRDLEYLMRLWDEIRELTLKSTAPALIYEEANLIKRAIRDLYDRDIDEIQVEGEEGYRAAKDFMRVLTPSHAKRVHSYKDEIIPLFHRFQVEGQIDAIYSPVVQLKSGGYIVLTPTEALVSIDVNSGRATKERNIEETATRTNLEAAEEIARQVRLRDLAGLIVIDFIDMEESRNNASVERRLKEAMRADRARIQIGRISPFGLLELSRQRLQPSLEETTHSPCPRCHGTGYIRDTASTALHVLRILQEEAMKENTAAIHAQVPVDVA
ncbi:MAG TPA: ribonuclease E/G, partial [Thermoanaerobaculia bacterium]|nr:ribonuclease E/G [Thermoanaerobaculia bacterium]